MSRLIRKPIIVPAGVTVQSEDSFVRIQGSKGELRVPVLSMCKIEVEPGGVRVVADLGSKKSRSFAGTMAAKIRNAIQGAQDGFTKKLEIEGVGYRAMMEGDQLVLSLGYVHPVRFGVPEGVTVQVEKNVITVSGIDRDLVGQTASSIKMLKRPEPYKGKGIRYQGEVIRRKAGKKAVASG